MPNTREKLMRLLCDALEDGCIGHCNYPPCYQVERATNHLIANGVTVQEWIPVTERLPERYKYVLLWDAMDRDVYMGVLDDRREWYVPGYQDEIFRITHWMPLPEPPKGE